MNPTKKFETDTFYKKRENLTENSSLMRYGFESNYINTWLSLAMSCVKSREITVLKIFPIVISPLLRNVSVNFFNNAKEKNIIYKINDIIKFISNILHEIT